MKIVIISLLALAAAVIAKPEEQYTDRYDNTNVEEILSNKRMRTSYIKCVLQKGPCTKEGNELKSHIKEALRTDCGKCTEVQKKWIKRVFEYLINCEPEYWKQLVEKYDTNNEYSKKHEEDLKKVKVVQCYE
uniref:Chemosensory protein n=1 Tax=Histia rhodope TaxID=1453155 RepID=A0A6M9BJU2_9NEOP|nr:chemosensory protein [Histia rhodope]